MRYFKLIFWRCNEIFTTSKSYSSQAMRHDVFAKVEDACGSLKTLIKKMSLVYKLLLLLPSKIIFRGRIFIRRNTITKINITGSIIFEKNSNLSRWVLADRVPWDGFSQDKMLYGQRNCHRKKCRWWSVAGRKYGTGRYDGICSDSNIALSFFFRLIDICFNQPQTCGPDKPYLILERVKQM